MSVEHIWEISTPHKLIFSSFLTAPAASQIVVRAFLGQPVTLPCTYPSWSPHSNSMCWGKGQCPNSKCNDELLYTDGTKVVSSKSPKYQLRGSIQRGDVSLTIINTNENDQSVYCCRIEVPGWFNDVKRNIRLDLRRGEHTEAVSVGGEVRVGSWSQRVVAERLKLLKQWVDRLNLRPVCV